MPQRDADKLMSRLYRRYRRENDMGVVEHAPRPWNCGSESPCGIVRDKNNSPVADCRYSEIPRLENRTPERIAANARLIVRAVNAHEELLEALERVATCGPVLCDSGHRMPCDCVGDAVRAAIAKAEGGA